MKKSNDATTLRHSREGGNPEAAVRNVGPVLFVGTPRQIPAFAGMTSACKAVRFLHALEGGNPEAAVRNVGLFFLVGTLRQIPAFAGMTSVCDAGMTSVCDAGVANVCDAGMTSVCKAVRFLHALEGGNPEAVVRNVGLFFLVGTLRQIPAFAGMTNVCDAGMTSVCDAGMTNVCGAVGFLHMLFCGNGEE